MNDKAMKYLTYVSLVASLIAVVGFAMNPYGFFGRDLTPLNADVNYSLLLFQVSSWLALIGGLITFFYKSDKKQKILGAIAACIPIAIFVYRYWFLLLCIFPNTNGCL